MTGPIEARAAEVHGARGGCVVCILDALREPFPPWDELSLTARERHRIYARALLAEELLREWASAHRTYLEPRAAELAETAPAWAQVVKTARATEALLVEFDQVVHWRKS